MSPVIAFEFQSQVITNPFLSPDRLQLVDPTTYGFATEHTGGNCTALYLTLPTGGFIRLTDEGGTEVPYLDEWEMSLVGLYDAQGEAVCVVHASELPGFAQPA